MEVSLCAKPLIIFHPLSSPIRARSFLGRRHNHRPRGIRLSSRKFSNRITNSPQQKLLVVRAAFDTESAAAVCISVVAVLALSAFFFDYWKRNHSAKQESGPSSLQKSEPVKVITNQLVKNQKSPLDTISAEESTESVKELLKSKYENDAEKLQRNENTLVPTETLITSRDEPPDTSIMMFLDESEVTGTPAPPSILSESAFSQLEESLQESELASDMAAPSAENQFNVAGDVTGNGEGEVADENPAGEIAELGQATSYGGIFRETSRQALHTFCGAYRSSIKSRLKLNGPRKSPSCVSFRDSNGISSQRGKSTANGVKVLMKTSVDIADPETAERNLPLPYYKEGSTYKSRDFRKRSGFPSEKKRKILAQDGGDDSQPPSSPNGIQVNGNQSTQKHLPFREMSAYDKLLRAGR